MVTSYSIAYLGPAGTFSETAALRYLELLNPEQITGLCPYASIPQAIKAVARREVERAIVPVENSIEGSVTTTLDTLWALDGLQVQQALVLPVTQTLISRAVDLKQIQTVYSHPQGLAQCQQWLEQNLPQVQLIPTSSTTEALDYLDNPTMAMIAAERAASLYNLPILARAINDHPANCTRFWALSLQAATGGSHTSLAFSVPANVPGALMRPLSIFASRQINLSRIESRPTKRSLGDYLFFLDLEADANEERVRSAIEELRAYAETLKIFGSYSVLSLARPVTSEP
ncbi:prephenate dehydratase [Leptolyngbya sp. FACHB-261]|uniref:prephenate dehydratase n=1 Tax=Leptolyngbya sp. FACHB-261 TaxID=2692806 RepID=UPI001681D4C3|nr:prephenate dehydratase [Leptolyngbya sp. FACHB-261]MBD2104751.1 prephenate dehydratase [Leptolyngbya sp. FACHB-261]